MLPHFNMRWCIFKFWQTQKLLRLFCVKIFHDISFVIYAGYLLDVHVYWAYISRFMLFRQRPISAWAQGLIWQRQASNKSSFWGTIMQGVYWIMVRIIVDEHTETFKYRQMSNISRTWQWTCWSLRCRRCSNYIFILDLPSGFNGLSKDNCKTRREC